MHKLTGHSNECTARNSMREVSGPDLFANNSWVPNYPFFFLADLETQVDSPLNVPAE